MLRNLSRKQALLHVLSGGYWFRRAKSDDATGADKVVLVKMGEAAAAHLCKSKSLARKIFDGLTSMELHAVSNPLEANAAELMVNRARCLLYIGHRRKIICSSACYQTHAYDIIFFSFSFL